LNLDFKNTKIRYYDSGKGSPVVLLHGYLESLNIWDDFARSLSDKFRVITVDLPGQGKSLIDGEISTMELMAECVNAVLLHLRINSAAIIGHSMGGYATLAMVEMYPEKVSAFGLFHSISWEDTDEKKKNRDREIDLIRHGKQDILFNTNIPKSFANDNLEKFKNEILEAKKIASQASPQGIIAVLEGMKERKNRTYLIEQTNKPVLFVVGKKDNYIPPERLLELASKAKNKYVVVLENSGHMGFIEEKQVALDEMEFFLNLRSE
jgi:pimeloyl-ACP methyl ester carboxylesterase